MSSGDNFNQFVFRVLTDMTELVIEKPMSEHALNPSAGITRYLLNGAGVFGFKPDQMLQTLSIHPKLVACRKTASKLQRHNAANNMELQQCIRLPFPCCHSFANRSLDNDPLFHEKRFLKHENGENWCHIELVGYIGDNFVAPTAKKEDPVIFDIKNVNPEAYKSQ